MAFAVPVVAYATGDHALAVVGGALVLKHVIEAVVARAGRTQFGPDGVTPRLRTLCSSQVLAYALGNVDYVVVAVVLGATAFSIYSLAYRVAVAVPSVVAYVATRTAVSDFSTADGTEQRQVRYSKYVRPLFVIGSASAVAAIGIGAVLPSLLGSAWEAVAPTIAVLALAAPWRMIAGQAGALAIADGSERHLVRWEFTRLVLFAAAFVLAATAGFAAFVAVVSCAWIIGVTRLHQLAARRGGLRSWRALVPLAIGACALAVAAAVLTGVSP
jgi:O-antigen/teichoic acid export membrane protein